MADSETKLSIASLGTRETVLQIGVDLLITAGAATTMSASHTFDNPFVAIPKIIGGAHYEEGAELIKGNLSVTAISKTAITVSSYQVLEADVADGTYNIKVDLVGWVAA